MKRIDSATSSVLCIPAVNLNLMGHAPLPELVREVLAAEIPRGPIGIAGFKRVANDREDLVEGVEECLVAREAHKRVLGGRRHHRLGNAQVGALQHFARVAEKAADSPARAVFDGCLKASNSCSCGKSGAFESESFDVIHRVVLHGEGPAGPSSFLGSERILLMPIPSEP